MPLVIRSSTTSEDTRLSSLAGYFESVLNVSSRDDLALEQAVGTVLASYQKDNRSIDPHDRVLIQPQVQDLVGSGVILTRMPDTRAPYYAICIDRRSGHSDGVTSGREQGIETYYIARTSTAKTLPTDIQRLVSCSEELIRLTHFDALDIEFGIDQTGTVYLFQLRPIADHPVPDQTISSDIDFEQLLAEAREYVRDTMTTCYHLAGQSNVLANMTDWNPAEMIGCTPNPLALSLYQRLIGEQNWARARSLMGYRDVLPASLIVSVAGHPYVDVRASLNSFLPATVPDALAEPWINACLDRLRQDPTLQDKVEFDLLPTCFAFDWDRYRPHFHEARLSNRQIEQFRAHYVKLTDDLIRGRRCCLPDLMRDLKTLNQRRKQILAQSADSPNLLAKRTYHLLEDCGRYGVVPFAVLARMGFMALAFLRSLGDIGLFAPDELEFIVQSIPTVTRDLSEDMDALVRGRLTKDTLIQRYGHLRENSYDITSPNYASAIERYLKGLIPQGGRAFPSPEEGRTCFLSQQPALDQQLQACGLSASASQLFEFIRAAIRYREFAKFEFMKNVNAALETVAQFAACFDLTREEISHIPIDEILTYARSSITGAYAARLRRRIGFQKKYMLLSRSLKLPDVIGDAADIEAHKVAQWRPNFVTHHKVNAPVKVLDNHGDPGDLHGAIVAMKAADPGYDWIFGHGIAGLITQYGGIGSHMAIRAAKFSLPAAIGRGAELFEKVKQAQRVTLDCANQQVLLS